MFTIYKKEISHFFLGFTAYIAAFVFTLICSLFLWFFDQEYNIFQSGLASLNPFFIIAPWVFLLLIPALTMKLIAEEQNNGTLLWLFTQPINTQQIVLGKFFAVLSVLVFLLVLSFVYVYSLQQLVIPEQNIDYGILFSAYIGIFLIGTLFTSVGLLSSSLSNNQVIAFVLAVFINFILYFGLQGLASYNLLGNIDYYVLKMSAQTHFTSFLKGVIDTRSFLYFIILSTFFIFATMQIIELKKRKS